MNPLPEWIVNSRMRLALFVQEFQHSAAARRAEMWRAERTRIVDIVNRLAEYDDQLGEVPRADVVDWAGWGEWIGVQDRLYITGSSGLTHTPSPVTPSAVSDPEATASILAEVYGCPASIAYEVWEYQSRKD